MEYPLSASIHSSQTRVMQLVLSLDPGGTERLVLEIAKRLTGRFDMRVCCLDAPGAWATELQAAGIPIVPLGRREGFQPSLTGRIAKLIDEWGVSVIHCHHYSPFVYGRLAALRRRGVRVVFTEHGRLSAAPPSLKRRFANQVLGRLGSRIFAVSADLKAHMVAEGMPSDRVEVLHNGIDAGPAPQSSERHRARQAMGLEPGEFVVGTVARLDPVKGLPTLVEAFAAVRHSVPRARLVIVGEGPERQAIERSVAEHRLGPAVRLLGQREDARQLLPGFDVFVNSSITEGVSLTILEAMAARVPVVATRVGGTPEVVLDDTTGLLVPAHDAGAMATAVLRVHADRDYAAGLAQNGRLRQERYFSIERMLDGYAAAYAN